MSNWNPWPKWDLWNEGGGGESLTWDLYVPFDTDDDAPLSSTIPGTVGSLSVVSQVQDQLSISGSVLHHASTGSTSNYADEHIRLSDPASLTAAPGRAIHCLVRRNFSGSCYFSLFQAGATTASITGSGRFYASDTLLYVDVGGSLYQVATIPNDDTWFHLLVVQRSGGYFFFLDGDLIWVKEEAIVDPVYASFLGARSRYGPDFDSVGSLLLGDNGYADYAVDDFSLVDCSGTTAPLSASYDTHSKGIHIVMEWTHEDGKQTRVRWRRGNSSNYLEVKTINNHFYVIRVIGGIPSSLLIMASELVNGENVRVDAEDDGGGTIRVSLRGVEVLAAGDVSGAGEYYDQASNFEVYTAMTANSVEWSANRYPALGIAYDRWIAPQAYQVDYDVPADVFAIFRNVTVGPSDRGHALRGTSVGPPYSWGVTITSTGQIKVVYSNGFVFVALTSTGAIVTGDDLGIWLKGSDCKIFVNNTLVQTGSHAGGTTTTGARANVTNHINATEIEYYPIRPALPVSLGGDGA